MSDARPNTDGDLRLQTGSAGISTAPIDESLYNQLRRLAGAYLSSQRPGHTLQPTALVHEAYLRLVRPSKSHCVDPRAFFATAARAMRSILVDHARTRARQKRGGHMSRIPLDDIVDIFEERALDLPALDDGLVRLGRLDSQLAAIVELRFFGGLTEEETAAVLGVSARTITRAWRRARAWLRLQLEGEDFDE